MASREHGLYASSPAGDAVAVVSEMLEAVGDALICFDADSRCTFVSANAESILGKRAKDLLGHTCREVFPEGERCSCEARPEEQVTVADFHCATLEARYKCVCYSRPGAQWVYLRNITENKQVEAQLRAAQSRSLLAQRVGRVGVFDWDMATGKVVWTEVLEELFGMKPGAFGGTHEAWAAHLTPEERGRVENNIESAIQEHNQFLNMQFEIRRADGEVRCMSARARLFYDGDGRAVRMLGTCQDVTDAREAEQALRNSEERFRTMGEALPYGVWWSDERGRLEYVSPSFLELTGMSLDELREMGWARRLAPEEQQPTIERWRRALASGNDLNCEHRILGTDGKYHTLLVRGKPIRDDQNRTTGWVGINLDISDRKEIEDRLRHNQRELRALAATLERRVLQRTKELEEKTNRLRGLASALATAEGRERERLAGVIHDHLQQILVAARMRVQIAKQGKPEVSGDSLIKVGDLLDEALQAARSLTSELRPPVLYEDGLIPALQWLAERARDQFRLEVRLDLHPEAEPRTVELRAILFESVRELLFNISKHAQVNRATIELSRSENDEVFLTVEDEGVGFDPARVDLAGGGMGLFRMRERMITLGGQADIDSVPGHGTRVLLIVPEQDISLPRHEQIVFEQQPTEITTSGVSGAIASGLIRVLVADDHRMVREGLVMVLESQPDISVVGQANDGREALDLTRNLKPDVIVMDVNMPNMNGIEATRTIRREFPEMVIIGVSAYGESGTAESMRSAGAVAYLEKGGEPDDLIMAVRQYASERVSSA